MHSWTLHACEPPARSQLPWHAGTLWLEWLSPHAGTSALTLGTMSAVREDALKVSLALLAWEGVSMVELGPVARLFSLGLRLVLRPPLRPSHWKLPIPISLRRLVFAAAALGLAMQAHHLLLRGQFCVDDDKSLVGQEICDAGDHLLARVGLRERVYYAMLRAPGKVSRTKPAAARAVLPPTNENMATAELASTGFQMVVPLEPVTWTQWAMNIFFRLIADTRVFPIARARTPAPGPQDLSALEALPKIAKGRLMQDAVVPHLLSNSGIEQLVFAGPFSGELKRCARPCPSPEAAYVVDYSALESFATRPGESTYGAAAYFSSSGRLLDVRGASGAGHGPEDARQMFVVSGVLHSTVCHHLLLIHIVTSGTLNRAYHALLKLPAGANHILIAALGPFVAGSTLANSYAALSLVEEGGQLLRAASLSAPGMANVSRFCLQRRFSTIAGDFEARGVSNLSDSIYPVRLDLTELEGIFQRFVLGTISSAWKTDEDLARDVGAQEFWRALRAMPGSAIPARLSIESLSSTLGTILAIDSGGHHLAGGLGHLALHPFHTALRRFADQLHHPPLHAVFSFFLIMVLTLAPGAPPPLISLYPQFYKLSPTHETAILDAAVELARELCALERRILQRNKHRRFPLKALLPSTLSSAPVF